MIKLIFILLGMVCFIFAIWHLLFPVQRKKNQETAEVLDVSPCHYCGDYVEKPPEFVGDVCQNCQRRREKSKDKQK